VRVAAFLLFPCIILAQQSTVTSGQCSPIAPNNNGSVTINCSGLNQAQQKLLESVPALLTKLLASQSDNTSEILSKLDACVAGVTQVKEQQAAWRITEQQRADLQRRLAGHHADVSINVIPQDRNAALFGIDLIAALKDYGSYDNKGLNTDYGLNPQIEGVVLLVSHPDFPEAVFLMQALSAVFGIPVRGEVNSKATGESIYIAVGAKPGR
jgi:hypothetical protein